MNNVNNVDNMDNAIILDVDFEVIDDEEITKEDTTKNEYDNKLEDLRKDILDGFSDDIIDEQLSLFKIKDNQGFNETNLMTLPFVWLKKFKKDNPVRSFERKWIKSDDTEVSITIVGGKYGVPCIAELDVLLALFRIYIKQMGNSIPINKDTKEAKLNSNSIHFTYRQLAKEIGYKGFGGATKAKLERSIKTLNESTMYTKFAVKDAKKGKYISQFNLEQSTRIIKGYRGYNKKDYIRENGIYLKANEIEDFQVVEIDNFFFENLCSSYFKVYDYEMYKKLKLGITKKTFLLLSTWSKSSCKFIKYQTLFDYIGLDCNTKKEIKYNKTQLSKALKELRDLGFIEDYKVRSGNNGGVEFIFNSYKTDLKFFKDRYTTSGEIVEKLRAINIGYDEISDLYKSNDERMIAGLLRYMDYREENGNTIVNHRKYLLTGLKRKYNIKDFI